MGFLVTSRSALAASTSKQKFIGSTRTVSFQPTPTDAAARISIGLAKEGATEGDSSVTPVYAPPPKRALKMGATLQSPYVAHKLSFKCSKKVHQVYNAICRCSGRTNRKKQLTLFCRTFIINCDLTYAELGHLMDSVKLRGKLKNTIAL